MDDILLYSLVASAKTPGDYAIGTEAYSVEPYGAMMPKDDPDVRQGRQYRHRKPLQERADHPDLRKMVPEADSAEGHQPECSDEPAIESRVCQSDE